MKSVQRIVTSKKVVALYNYTRNDVFAKTSDNVFFKVRTVVQGNVKILIELDLIEKTLRG